MVSLKGDAEAYIEGLCEEARIKGLAEGRVEGRVEERLDLAKKLVKRLDVEEVAEITGLSKDQILSNH